MLALVFNYLEALDCFVVNSAIKELISNLGLNQWNEVVWIGRHHMCDKNKDRYKAYKKIKSNK